MQLLAGGFAGLAHAREPVDAPVRIESTKHERCPVVHDASACVVCSYVHARAVVHGRTIWAPPRSHPRPTAQPSVQVVRPHRTELSTAPRGPPLPHV